MWLYFQTSLNSLILRHANETFVFKKDNTDDYNFISGNSFMKKKPSISWCIHNGTMKFQGTFAFACVHM